MAYYLQMDGVDDRLQTPAFAYTEVILDMAPDPTGKNYAKYIGGNTYFQRAETNQDNWTFTNVYKNGVAQTPNTLVVVANERATYRAVSSTLIASGIVYIFSVASSAYMKGNLYSVKFYNGATLVAHYDMTLGNVQDQSGNGNHATLTGGTWVSDATGTTYSGSGTAAGLSSASDTNKLTAEASGTVAGLSSASGNPNMIYAANGTAQGLSDVSTIASAILNAMGTSQGQSNVSGNEIYVYSANGSVQGVSNVTGNELIIYLGSGAVNGSSSLTSNDTFTGVSGTAYSGSGTAVGGSNVSAVERMILAAAGTAQGASTITTHELITLMASGIASGYSTVTFVDNSMQIIGRIELKGERQLYVYLQGHRDLTINLKGSI
jgi:hypothetical protein